MATYKIKITRVESYEEPAERVWRKVWDTPPAGKEQYGYSEPPAPRVTRTRDVEVLSQTVEALDVAEVIRAVNGL